MVKRLHLREVFSPPHRQHAWRPLREDVAPGGNPLPVMEDAVLCDVKASYQAAGRLQVRDGERTRESLHFIDPARVRLAEVFFPDGEF